MSEKTPPYAQNGRADRPEKSTSSEHARRESIAPPDADPTVQLRLDDIKQTQDPEGADSTKVLSERSLLASAHADISPADETTTSFDIPADMIEPLDHADMAALDGDQETSSSNKVSVYDPFKTRKSSVVSKPQARNNRNSTRSPCSTIKMKAARGDGPNPGAPPSSTSAKTANHLNPAKLRDIDADGFYVFIARPDANGRVSIPLDLFGEYADPEESMILLKAKILRQE